MRVNSFARRAFSVITYLVSVSTMPEHPTASWQAMQGGSVFYRRQQLFTLEGKLPNFGEYIVAGCRYGGPIGMGCITMQNLLSDKEMLAMMRDSTKIIALNRAAPSFTKSQIQVFSSAGEGLLLFSVDMSLRFY
jgi:vacuolar protein sorting-associated protein 16